MIKNIQMVNIIIFLLMGSFLFSNPPDWEYTPGAWAFTSWIAAGIVLSDDGNLAAEGDIFAAFDEAETVRGIAVQVNGFGPTAGQIMYEMTIGSNTNGDLISFKYYDASEDAVLDIAETYAFVTNDQQGSLVEPVFYHTGDVYLSFSNVTPTSVDINYISNEGIAGFQFNVEGINLMDASGGSAEAAGFSIVTSTSTVLGFSLSGSTIPSGSGTFLSLEFEESSDATITISNIVISNSNGSVLSNNGPIQTLPFNPIIDYSFGLNAGNNLISFNVIPSDNSLENVLSSLGGTADALIGEGIAAINSGSGWVGGLTTILYADGYWLQVNQSATLNLTGIPISPNQTYTLQSGNNLISYPLADCGSIDEVLPDDIEDCIYAIGGEGIAAVNTGDGWIGGLQSLCPNDGYWFTNQCNERTFTFDEPTGLARRDILSPSPYPYNQSSQQAFYFIESVVDIEIGDWILAYNEDMVIGARQWTGDIIDVPAMGDDGCTFTSGYITSGTTPQFKLLQGDKLTDLTGEVSIWSDNQIFMVKSLMPLPDSYSLSAAYPNPFNPTTTLNFAIPVNNNVIFEVYDINGRIIKQLHNNYMSAGYHKITWNADANSSGIYFVKMVSGEYIKTQKLMLVK